MGSRESWGVASGVGLGMAPEEGQLLVLKVGPSVEEAVSMLTDVERGLTSLERQSAALFFAPDIHSKVMLYVASSRLQRLTLLLAFLPFKNLARGLWSFLTIISVPCR